MWRYGIKPFLVVVAALFVGFQLYGLAYTLALEWWGVTLPLW